MPADALQSSPLVVFVGAGASAIAPSSLPGWIDFNSTLLECLGEQLATYSRNRQPVDEMLAAIKERRDTTSFLPPDFQAQLMEEEIGADYFRVWQSIDTDVFGPVHAGIAELAAQGRIAAIVTTNFDRLLEVALEARGVPFSVFHDAAAFNRLGADVTATALPVLKIHGSIEDADSLVDTLRQRLTGRPQALTAALRTLLTRHHWLFLGFSGADFSYDPHYLGILDAADEACGFTFVARDGTAVQPGVTTLAARFGDKATVTTGDLRTWLADTFTLPRLALPDAGARTAESARADVRAHITAWAERLGPMPVVNILCAMLRSINMEPHAHWLLRRTWKKYRTPADTRSGPSYDRYNHNYGLSLLARGAVGNAVGESPDADTFQAWHAAADEDAWQFFDRAWGSRTLYAAGAQLATCTAYKGGMRVALEISSAVTARAFASGDHLAYCDAILAGVPMFEMAHSFSGTLPALAQSVHFARQCGDEPRRAYALVALARFLCFDGDFGTARAALQAAREIADRLALTEVHLHCRAAHGRILLDSEADDAEAVVLLQSVVDELHDRAATPLFTRDALGDSDARPVDVLATPPQLCRALLDLNRAARFTGNVPLMNGTLAELRHITNTHFAGYLVHTNVAHAECHLHHTGEGSLGVVAQCIDNVRDMYSIGGNPYAAKMIDVLTAALHEARARSTPGDAAD